MFEEKTNHVKIGTQVSWFPLPIVSTFSSIELQYIIHIQVIKEAPKYIL